MGQSTFRNDMYTDYKQNRPAPPEELIPQFDYVKEISDQFGFINVGMTNYEADDVIGTLAKHFLIITRSTSSLEIKTYYNALIIM